MEIEIEEVKTERKIFTVGELTKHIRFTLEEKFRAVWVEGEVSNFIHHTSGHMYFSMKDADATLSCVMFKRDNMRLKFDPEAGQKVVCFGMISLYPPRGQYQLTVQLMEPKGIGALQIAFEKLKNKLLGEGLFEEGRKRPIPFYPAKIGIVTSITGAVIQDILHVLNRRHKESHLIIYPAKVQGEGAKEEIVSGIKAFNEQNEVDVIILARGGGSLEDLWAFNEEVVARAIYNSNIPIISAVGHEVDYTIADFVADFRAPTPSAAAEIVLPSKQELKNLIIDTKKRLRISLSSLLEQKKSDLKELLRSRIFRESEKYFDSLLQKIDDLQKVVSSSLVQNLKFKTQELESVLGRMEALSPLSVLKRGYSIVFDSQTQQIIKSTTTIKAGQDLKIRLSDGEIEVKVTKK